MFSVLLMFLLEYLRLSDILNASSRILEGFLRLLGNFYNFEVLDIYPEIK